MLICHLCAELVWVDHTGFPHSEIPGSQTATRLTEAYRSYATSFIAFSCQGIHRTPLRQMKTDYFNARFHAYLPVRTYLDIGSIFCCEATVGTEKPRSARLIQLTRNTRRLSAAVVLCFQYHR